ncbi:NAD(P)/FAD-dependent oxidoreductase [Bacillus horti]|uniref:Thioredoxin reductase n=1 Tax=Caldalkalibacillus horti TaxID=77523 RepID=A0ABT9VW01_9BACI|nr:thioredoxin reductase [Bacillus horti]
MYDVIVIGGGIAGLQAAIQLGRYMYQVLVIDSGIGRSTISQSYHNILGYPDGVSGNQLRLVGQQHAVKLGVKFIKGYVHEVKRRGEAFECYVGEQKPLLAKRILLATGVMDRIPAFPELYPCLGLSVFVCPDCDGYEVKNKKTIVLGAGNTGAKMALTLTHWTNQLVFVNHEKKGIDDEIKKTVKEKNIEIVEEQIVKVLTQNHSEFTGVELVNGQVIYGQAGFIAFGGNEVKSQLAEKLGVKLLENSHIAVDPRTKQTSVEHVWAAGDIVAHSEQVTIAMGEGSQAAIWIHKSLKK